ncbi:hypothetical protein [Streptosporangium sp. KLBMP 9127]|nr:hypothetical protein [Streptosporangium sp. KLBMP 9127]
MFGIDDKTAIRYANAARRLLQTPRKRPNHRDTIGVVILRMSLSAEGCSR